MLSDTIFKPISLAWAGIGLAWVGIRHRLTRTNKLGLKQVELPGHKTLWVDESLNFIGNNCLRTNLLTKLLLDEAVAGTVVEICSDNLSALETIPFMLPNCNCEHLATLHEPTCQKIYVRKRESQAALTDEKS